MDNKIDYSLIARYLKGETNGDDSRLVNTWLESDEKNKKLFDFLKMSWEAENTEESSETIKSRIWGNIESKIQSTPERQFKGKNVRLYFLMAAAASIALFIIASMFFLFPKKHALVSSTEIQVLKNMTKNAQMVALPDGTHVWLNKGASLSYNGKYDDFNRSVKLSGEAYFEVIHNPQKPFTVATNAGLVKVLGTSFNIHPNSFGKTDVDVFTGIVKCELKNDSSKQMILHKGQHGILDPAKHLAEKDSLFDENILAWKTGIIEFHNSSLQKVCQTLSSYFDTTIICSPNVSNLSLSVQFSHPQLDKTLKVIGLTLDLQVQADNKGLLFKETQ